MPAASLVRICRNLTEFLMNMKSASFRLNYINGAESIIGVGELSRGFCAPFEIPLIEGKIWLAGWTLPALHPHTYAAMESLGAVRFEDL